MNEQKDVVGYEGIYRISNNGRLFAYPSTRVIINRWGFHVYVKTPDRELSVGKSGRYWKCTLSKDKTQKTYLVHRLVALAFIPNPLNLPQINHKDGDKSNNHVVNLEWTTQAQNIQHAFDTGLINKENCGKHMIGKMPHGTKEVLDLNTGIYYESMKAAEKASMITPNTLRGYLKENSRYIGSPNHQKFTNRFMVLQ